MASTHTSPRSVPQGMRVYLAVIGGNQFGNPAMRALRQGKPTSPTNSEKVPPSVVEWQIFTVGGSPNSR
jgi:hypothetical protein